MLKQYFISLIVLFISCTSTQAQILSLDKDFTNSRYKEDKHLYADLSFSFSHIDNENILMSLKLSSDITYIKGKSAFASLTDYFRSTFNDDIFRNAGYTQLIYRYGFQSKLTPEFIAQYQWDDQMGMDNRFLLGMNLRHKVHKSEKTALIYAGGFMYEDETWHAVSDTAIVKNIHMKINLYLSYFQKIGQVATLSLNSYFQAIPNENIVYPRISPGAQLAFKITEKLSFITTYSFQYDPKPVVPIRKYHYVFTNGILLKL